MLKFFSNLSVENIYFNSEDIPYLLKGLEMNCQKIHYKMIRIFKWIINYQTEGQIILKYYVNFLETYIERIRDTTDKESVIEEAKKFLNEDLIKIKS